MVNKCWMEETLKITFSRQGIPRSSKHPLHMDTDRDLAILIELFPDVPIEEILNEFLICNGNLDLAISKLLGEASQGNHLNDQEHHEELEPDNVNTHLFHHLKDSFPDVEVEAINVFLATITESLEEEEQKFIVGEFMRQCSGTQTPKSSKSNLKMKLSDFEALLKTSSELTASHRKPNLQDSRNQQQTFIFSCTRKIVVF